MTDHNDVIVAVAKTTEVALETSQQFGGFISRIVGIPLQQAAAIWADKLSYHRLENQVRLQLKAERFMKEVGWDRPDRHVPLKFAVPLLSAATLEDDPSLQDWWAKLLVNAASSNSAVSLQRSYIDVLGSLEPLDALILSMICQAGEASPSAEGWATKDLPMAIHPYTDDLYKENGQPSPEVELALANLERLGCVSGLLLWNGGKTFRGANVTFFGMSFFKACSLPSS